MNCNNGKHFLVKVYEVGSDMESDVVRWCKDCGAVVVDKDYDGRTNPGAIRVMEFPNITRHSAR